MKKNILTLIILVIISMTPALSQRESRLNNLHFIPEGELVKDSVREATVKSFWISNQITNEEFREFWNYAKNNTREELMWADMSQLQNKKSTSQPVIKKIKYFEILKDTLNTTQWPTEDYFEAQKFNASPVIGVSEELANHYCIWKTSKTYDKLSDDERHPVSPYFLPTTLQMKYARKTKPTIFSDDEVGFRIVIME